MTQFNVDFLLPPGTGLQLTHLHQMPHQQLVLVVNSTSLLASCPVCQTSSRQGHSYYTRTVEDLCWADMPTRCATSGEPVASQEKMCHFEKKNPNTFSQGGTYDQYR